LSSYVFPGYPVFLEAAANEIGRPESAALARRIAPLAALANLCAQAALGDPAHAEGILAKAAEFRDQLAIALRAAELMLADVEAGRARSRPAAQVRPEPKPAEPLPARKGPRTLRGPS